MKFRDMLTLAKLGDSNSMELLLEIYQPLMLKEAIIDGVFDEDLFQELQIVFVHCVKVFCT